jgi:hypothetical protein
MNETLAGIRWRLEEFFLPAPRTPAPRWALAGRTLLLLGVAAYGFRFHRMSMRELTDSNGAYFLHAVHLVIHEAGHVIFSWFGDFMHVLGGSLLQVLMPFLWFLAARFKGRDAFAGALCLWLMGHSLLDVAPYINDARALQLVLLGGSTGQEVEGHDWEYLLTQLGWMRYDVYLAHYVLLAGKWLMALSLAWAGAVLGVQWRDSFRTEAPG